MTGFQVKSAPTALLGCQDWKRHWMTCQHSRTWPNVRWLLVEAHWNVPRRPVVELECHQTPYDKCLGPSRPNGDCFLAVSNIISFSGTYYYAHNIHMTSAPSQSPLSVSHSPAPSTLDSPCGTQDSTTATTPSNTRSRANLKCTGYNYSMNNYSFVILKIFSASVCKCSNEWD